MRRVIALLALLALAGCGNAEPIEVVCTPKVLAAKIDRYALAAARLADRATATDDPELKARFQAFATSIGETSDALSRRLAGGEGSGTTTSELCRAYDELQAIVDEATRGSAPAVEAPPVSPARPG